MDNNKKYNPTLLPNFESDELKSIDIASRYQIDLMYPGIDHLKYIYKPNYYDNESFLPYIADYFAVSFYRYFLYSGKNSDFDIKNLIKNTPYLSHIAGTKASLIGVLDTIGIKADIYEWFETERLEELSNFMYNSLKLEPYQFLILLNLENVDESIQEQLKEMVNIYKNVRSKFVLGVIYSISTKCNTFSVVNVCSETISLTQTNS